MSIRSADVRARRSVALPRTSPVQRVIGLTAAVVAATVALLTTIDAPTTALAGRTWWMTLAIAVGFGLAERYVFHIEFRREAVTFTLSEAPTVYALVFLDPLSAIVVRVVVSMAVHVIFRRPPPYKVAFNAATFAFETALAFALVRLIVGVGSFDGGVFLLAAPLAVIVATYAGSNCVLIAIACFEGRWGERFIEELRTGALAGPVSASIAALAVSPALFEPHLAVLGLVPVVAVWYVLVLHGRLSQQHRDLTSLHGLAGQVNRSLDLDDVVPTALDEAAHILRAESGLLQIYDADGETLSTAVVGEDLIDIPQNAMDPAWVGVLDTVGAVVYDMDDDGLARALAASAGRRLAVPIRDRTGLVGLLLLADRSGVETTFADDDLDRASHLGGQLAAALRNAVLHAEIEHAALHDALTGLRNRAGFDLEVDEIMASLGSDETAAVLMLDLDRFKEVNDTLGHHVGDRILTAFGERVGSFLSDGEVFARFGGDEFAALIRRSSVNEIRNFADAIVRASHTPLKLDGYDVVNTVSVGIAVITDGDRDTAAAIRRADIAMYAAKREHSGFEMYREEIDRRTPERLSLLGDLHDALEQGQLTVHFQPKVNLADARVVGAEALVRWEHPERGMVSPVDFIRLAEETGLVKRITEQMLDKSLATLRSWLDDGFDLGVAVNLSTLDLLDDHLPDRVADLLTGYGIDEQRLTLEITESSLMSDTPRTMSTIDRLHALGVRLSLDDFGTGYSSLSYLRQLPVSELKVDRSFVSNLLLDVQDAVIVRSTIDLGHNLGLAVTAEGIENDPVMHRLVELGCDLGQGYGISRPLPNDQFLLWLDTTTMSVGTLPVGATKTAENVSL